MNYYQRKKESEAQNPYRQVPYNQCNHGSDMWCQNCIACPQMVDMSDIGLGRGYVMGNFMSGKELEREIRGAV